ncbi:uncharacterized protein K452DRAFT_304237 [Aplosporella prunicola CBS 121167]|uniref:DUF7730 domain-containing protein n=1 Tax=Aplosporella prunicola CBS 121167 TaxID=1176127 RepID=A0A6A6BXD3_9PEZI|nr:uncharacterized protein K452DRAFT_304237 [Aplosporella prunicola CBS 121167]KAF2147391.1 hypothetical protein K452DRAFT_304237 [Aplosporella prunicola CBS 121167]
MCESRPHLLGLPAEVRNMIWEFVFPALPLPAGSRTSSLEEKGEGEEREESATATSPSAESSVALQQSASTDNRTAYAQAENKRNLAVLLTCHQIHHEASLLAFARTTFEIQLQRHGLLAHRLSVLRPPQVRAMRSLAFTAPLRHRLTKSGGGVVAWEGDTRPLLFPVYVQCRKLLWEALRLLPGVRSVGFVVGEGGAVEAVGGARFFFDTVVGVGLVERGKRGELHSWGGRWQVLAGEADRSVWLVESADEEGCERMMGLESRGVKRQVRVELARF